MIKRRLIGLVSSNYSLCGRQRETAIVSDESAVLKVSDLIGGFVQRKPDTLNQSK
jgi:hypothetical protein